MKNNKSYSRHSAGKEVYQEDNGNDAGQTQAIATEDVDTSKAAHGDEDKQVNKRSGRKNKAVAAKKPTKCADPGSKVTLYTISNINTSVNGPGSLVKLQNPKIKQAKKLMPVNKIYK